MVFRRKPFANFHLSHNYFSHSVNPPPRFRFTFFMVHDSYLGISNNVTILKYITMKMLLTSLLALGIPFLSFAGPTAATLMELTSVRCTYNKVRITFKEPMEKVFISILNENGEQFVKTKYKTKEPVTVPYDLSGLPAGDYQVKIETEDEIAIFDVKT